MGNSGLSIKRETMPEGVRLILSGHVDTTNADVLQIELDKTIRNGSAYIVMNMSDVDYLCSMGIRVILKAYKDADRMKGRLSIEEPSETVKKVLVLTALDKILIK